MDRNDSIIKKLENITYLMELVRSEIDRATYDSLTDYGEVGKNKVEIQDITEGNGSILEGFTASIDNEKGVIITFRDGRVLPLYSFETDNMYDLFVRIHSEFMDEPDEENEGERP